MEVAPTGNVMKSRTLLCIGAALALLSGPAFAQTAPAAAPAAPATTDADPALWVVKDKDTTIYLFGTIHVLKSKNSANLPENERFDLNLPDIAEVWRRGSVISSWLLDLTAIALAGDKDLAKFSGHVADSGEGRWTLEAAMEEAVPVNVLSAALYARYRSRQDATFGDKMLSAMRFGFGGHVEIPQ